MLDVRFLGQFEVLRGGRHVTIPTRNAQSLFAYLLLNAGKAHRRERLAGLLWPDSSEENARSNLRHELWRLRKALDSEGETYFVADDLTVGFNPQGEYSLDVHKLDSASLESSTADDLIGALSVYHGELLPGFYDEWVFVERDRLNVIFEAKIARLLEMLQGEGRWGEVVEWGNRWIALGGWPEPAYRALMAAYANAGDISKAVATYERYARALQKELGMKPSEQTQALYKRLKAGWKTDTRISQPPKPQMDRPAPTFPLPRAQRTNLPKPLTSFVGREKEIQQVEDLVSKVRLITITGSSGVGKTRLAIRVAEALAPQYRDGVWWVELVSISGIVPSKQVSNGPPMKQDISSGGDLINQELAKILRVAETPGIPILEAILEHLHDKQLLLVLDNCEHLIEACAALAERMLGVCPEVTILATSREALGVPGEKAWMLPPLSLPAQEHSLGIRDIVQSEAVSLFIERAGDILSHYQPGEVEAPTIAQICLRLDGIPLAIELAAARRNLLSTQEIAARLDQRFSLLTGGRRTDLPRHQTLRAAIEWSHDLLSEGERALFRRLSIFAGSFTLEAIEATCTSQEIHSEEVLALIGRLVDKSLVTVQTSSQVSDLPTRYRLLETIRSFGLLKLEEAGETRWMRDRHAEYYVRLVEAADPESWLSELRGIGLAMIFNRPASYYLSMIEAGQVEVNEPELNLEDRKRWYKLLQAENDNLRAVIEWGADSDRIESALRLVGALLWYWYYFGSPHEGRDLALKALATPSGIQYPVLRARALNSAGFLQVILGNTTSARQELEEALTILRASEDEASLAWCLHFLGLAYTLEREYELADAALKEGSTIAKKLGDVIIQGFSFFQGDIDLQRGDYSQAKTRYEESVNFQRVYGNKAFLAYPLRRLGYLALEQGDTSNAWSYFRESLSLNHEVGDKPGVAACLTSMAALALHLDKPVLAARFIGVVESRLELHSMKLLSLDQAELEHIRSQLQASLDEATSKAAFSEGWGMSEEQAIELVGEIIEEED